MEKNTITNLFEHYAIKTVLALLGIIGTVFTFITYFQENEVNLKYEITANTNVLDFNADVNKLEVFYDSTNLKLTKENLRIYTIKVINNGRKDLIKEYYDSNDPLGIMISTGQIIENPEIIQSSNDYIKRNIKISNFEKAKITFSQIILETNEYFIIKLLILHKTDSIPRIIPIGKIAGQKDVIVINSFDIKENSSYLLRAFKGTIGVQLLRLFGYALAFIGLIIIIVSSIASIDSYHGKIKRKRILNEFMNLKNYKYSRMDEVIFDYFKNEKTYYLDKIQTLLDDGLELNILYKKLSEEIKQVKQKNKRDERFYYEPTEEEENWTLINDMIKDGFLIKEKQNLIINSYMKDTLNKFLAFLQKNNYNKYSIRPTLKSIDNLSN